MESIQHLCECGCGLPTRLATQNNPKRGHIKGQPVHYVAGHNAARRGTEEERFWSKVDTSSGPDACWLWMAGRDKDGYGISSLGHRAHRASYGLTHGPIPKGMLVCHTCDNPPCCNPKHLWLGTQKQNTADSTQKGRRRSGDMHPSRVHPEDFARGERHGNAKLTEAQVREIRSLYAQGYGSYGTIAREYGVTKKAIFLVVKRILWKHVV